MDKWTAISFLLSREGHTESLLIYAGDDVGDEPVFARMSGISILGGKRPRNRRALFARIARRVAAISRASAGGTEGPVGEGAFLSASSLEEALPHFGPWNCAKSTELTF